jgi:hypothetical protein
VDSEKEGVYESPLFTLYSVLFMNDEGRDSGGDEYFAASA